MHLPGSPTIGIRNFFVSAPAPTPAAGAPAAVQPFEQVCGQRRGCKTRELQPIANFKRKANSKVNKNCKLCIEYQQKYNRKSNPIHNHKHNRTPRKKQRNAVSNQIRNSSHHATKLAASMAATDEAEPMLAPDSPELLSEVRRQVQVVAAQVERLKSTSASATVYVSVGNTAKTLYTTEVAGSVYYDSYPRAARSQQRQARARTWRHFDTQADRLRVLFAQSLRKQRELQPI